MAFKGNSSMSGEGTAARALSTVAASQRSHPSVRQDLDDALCSSRSVFAAPWLRWLHPVPDDSPALVVPFHTRWWRGPRKSRRIGEAGIEGTDPTGKADD